MKKLIYITLIFCSCSVDTGSTSIAETIFLSTIKGSYTLTSDGASALNDDYTTDALDFTEYTGFSIENRYIEIFNSSSKMIFQLAEAQTFTSAVYKVNTYSSSKLTDGIYFMVYLDSSTNIWFSSSFADTVSKASSLTDTNQFAARKN